MQVIPKGSQGFEKKEKWAGEIEEKIEQVSSAHVQNQLQEAFYTIAHGSQGNQRGDHQKAQSYIKELSSVELSEHMVNATIEKLSEAVKVSNKEKEDLLEALKKANKVVERKQKELEEVEGEADQLADKVQGVASQRNAAKADVEALKSKLSQKEAESSAITVELARKNKELEKANYRVAILEKENALFRKLLNMSGEETIEGRIKTLKLDAYPEVEK